MDYSKNQNSKTDQTGSEKGDERGKAKNRNRKKQEMSIFSDIPGIDPPATDEIGQKGIAMKIKINEQKLGIEIEMTGITRNDAAVAIANLLNTTAVHEGGAYDTYRITDKWNRTWKIMRDSSIRTMIDSQRVELVTPILYSDKCETLKKIVNLLVEKGAYVNNSCGIHVHVDAANHNIESLKNLIKIFGAREPALEKIVNLIPDRKMTYCQPVEKRVLKGLKTVQTMEDLKNLWYNGVTYDSTRHYSHTRYRMLNLHNVWFRGTVEVRMFNATLDIDTIMAYAQFCLAVSATAINLDREVANVKPIKTQKQMISWLKRCGLTGKAYRGALEVMSLNLA